MTSGNPAMQFKAVTMMIDLEKTRLRHHHALAGMDTAEPVVVVEPEQLSNVEDTLLADIADDIERDRVFVTDPYVGMSKDEMLIRMAEESDRKENGPKLTDEEERVFDRLVDEVYACNKQRDEARGLVAVDRDWVASVLWSRLCEATLDELVASTQRVLDKQKARNRPFIIPS
jgi:hypothetical protein